MKTQPIIKNENIKAIYRAVCRNKAISRAGIARDLGLSKPTVSLLVDELIREGFLRSSTPPGFATRGNMCPGPDAGLSASFRGKGSI